MTHYASRYVLLHGIVSGPSNEGGGLGGTYSTEGVDEKYVCNFGKL